MATWKPKARHQCADCGIWEGELHLPTCTMEECPVVGCRWTRLQCPTRNHAVLPQRPYLQYPVLCARCGSAFPPIFWATDTDWLAVVGEKYRHITLCQPCYRWMRRTLHLLH